MSSRSFKSKIKANFGQADKSANQVCVCQLGYSEYGQRGASLHHILVWLLNNVNMLAVSNMLMFLAVIQITFSQKKKVKK